MNAESDPSPVYNSDQTRLGYLPVNSTNIPGTTTDTSELTFEAVFSRNDYSPAEDQVESTGAVSLSVNYSRAGN